MPVDSIRVSSKKLRKLSAAKIRQYVRDFESGDDFPPIEVLCCGDFYVVDDGRHRFQAQLICGFERVAVIILN